jgi:protein SCO1/2
MLPLDAAFVDPQGRNVRLGDYFVGKPVLLVFAYYECPMLCTLVLNGLLRAMRALPFDAGNEYNVVTVSIDPGETPELARAKQKEYLKNYGRAGAENGWTFLTGQETEIRRLASAAGFRYEYDPETDEYAHATAIIVVTPEGRLSKYFYGVEYAAKDLRLGLVEASSGKIGTAVDQILLFCFHYDPATGTYGLLIIKILRLAGIVTVAGIGVLILLLARRDRKKRRSGAGPGYMKA